jgi:hypothetical protein
MLKLSSLKRDLQKENEGDWVPVADWPGVCLKVRSIASKDYQVAREMLVTKLTRSLGRLPTSPEMEPMLGKLVAAHLLRGWKGIAGDDEKPLAYDPKVAVDMLADPAYRELEQQVILAASRIGDRDVEFVTDATKNSEQPSGTT